MSSLDLITLGLLALQVGFVLMMIVYLISGLDDLFFDLLFFVSKAVQWSGGNSKHRQPSLEEMAEKSEQPFALMFPAWQEADVIRRALLNTISNIDYHNFHVFVGTYVRILVRPAKPTASTGSSEVSANTRWNTASVSQG